MTAAIEAVAEAVEAVFEQEGLRVTMGGEPTFIPTDPEGGEWNLQALGPEKLGYARRIAARLLAEHYPGGLVMQVFGKQYPGEPLPRWVILLLHRRDGVPLWRRPQMLALDDEKPANGKRDARALVAELAAELGLKKYVLPCVEADAEEAAPRGWVLPLDRDDEDWVSDRWPYSHEAPVVLVPGHSPLGLRLPMGDLGERHLRRALTVEATDGELKVFVPPLGFEPFCALVRVVERAARARRLSGLVLCGYRPLERPSVTTLGLAADPGVLEVNLPAASTWREYDRVLRNITRAAEAEGLVTTRLHLNGQVQGTGGGAHILFGGPSIEDNPFFTRPSLLSSILRYWQRHPALSYFFSGQYVGPGSQAPRADETLMSKLYELETACFGADVFEGASPDRGLLDRLFRNLLTDGAGNTHLAEVSIDKLWNYDSPTGLQGLIELRAFSTMPEVAQQSLCALFVRSIVAMLAAKPCEGPLRRLGARLHDEFMLPSALWADLREVCADLAKAGLPFELGWLREMFEWRFPVLGTLELGRGEAVIRQALEPWPLMAEMSDGGATSRMVDNSTDRLEVSVDDARLLGEGRVLVDGIALRFAQVGDVMAAGIRYKAAGGWPALHPHVPVQSPIRIEIVDSDDRIVASARYYYWNPDAPRYEGRPSSVEEAEARRLARWRPDTSRVGQRVVPRAPSHTEEAALTLDLRRQPKAE